MTVQGQTPATVDRQAADRLFTDIYAQHWDRLVRHIYFRLDLRHAHMAEDLAQDVFMRFWKDFVLPGRLYEPDNQYKVYALLKKMTQGPISDFYELCSTRRDRSLDFADPANAPIITNGHAYALDAPGLRSLVDDLETAMDHMATCSDRWRSLHKERHTLRGQLADGYLAARGGLTEGARARITSRLSDADTEEVTALDDFRQACARVGQLRADIEAEAGANWKSAAGMPVTPESTAFIKGRYRNDRSVTHCPEGHLLDKDNTHFGHDGARSCRACKATATAKSGETRLKNPTKRGARPTVSDEAIAQARALLSDPTHGRHSLPDIAKELGVSHQTLMRRIPDYKDLRSAALAGVAR